MNNRTVGCHTITDRSVFRYNGSVGKADKRKPGPVLTPAWVPLWAYVRSYTKGFGRLSRSGQRGNRTGHWISHNLKRAINAIFKREELSHG